MLNIIVACTDKENVIGKDNKLPWNLPEDLQHFKEITMGKTIVMGRKTFESLPKVLPGRHHIVLTRNREYKVNNPNVEIVTGNINNIFKKMKYSEDEYFIIGGAEIYKTGIKFADKIYLTRIYENIEGDAYFPTIDDKYWNISSMSQIIVSKQTGLIFSYEEYCRRTNRH